MAARKITPHTPAASVFGDEYRRSRTYTNWRPHGGPDWLLIYTAGGAGKIGLGGGHFRTRPGDLLLYDPGALQDYGTAPEGGRWHLLWAHFVPRANWLPWLLWPSKIPGIRLLALPKEMRPPVEEALRRMIRACRRGGPIQIELAMAAMEETILWTREARGGIDRAATDARINHGVELLTDGFKEPFRLPELARKCGLSVSRFSDLFRRQLGKSPGEFVELQRLSHAAHLLRLTEQSIGVIAGECGFADPFYFTNRFRRRHGMSPSRFRGSAREEIPSS